MIIRLFIYRIKMLLKNRVLLFWTLLFPILLGLLFNMAFSNLDKVDNLETMKIGIVSKNAEKTASFSKILNNVKNAGKPLFASRELSKKQATQRLAEDKIAGYYEVSDQTIQLYVNKHERNQLILNQFLNQYLQNADKAETLIKTGAVQPQALSAANFVQGNHVQSQKRGTNFSIKSFYFFTLVGMAVMYAFPWGLRNANDQQANQSPNGLRLCVSPKNKLLVSVTNMLASFVLFYIGNLIILGVFRFVYQVDFGDRWAYILLVCALGGITSLAAGTLLGSLLTKWTFQQKITLGMSVFMALGVLAGMTGTVILKYWIDQHVPLLGKLNFVNLISDSLYQLFYYDSLTPFYTNLVWLAGFAVVFVFLNHLFERRVQYDYL